MTVPFFGVCGPKFAKYWDSVENSLYCSFHVVLRLSTGCFIPKKCSSLNLEVVEKTTKCIQFLVLNFLVQITPNFYNSFQRDLLSTVWQSLVVFRSLTSLCEAWQCSRMQNLRKVGKSFGHILSRLWTTVHEMLCGAGDPLQFHTPFRDCLYRVLFRTVQVALKLHSRRNTSKIGGLGLQILGERIHYILDVHFHF